MIKIVKVENLVKYARNCASFLESDRLSEKTKSEYRLRAETICWPIGNTGRNNVSRETKGRIIK